MNYDITYVDTLGKSTFRIYNAGSLIEAVMRFQEKNKDCRVVKAEEAILQ